MRTHSCSYKSCMDDAGAVKKKKCCWLGNIVPDCGRKQRGKLTARALCRGILSGLKTGMSFRYLSSLLTYPFQASSAPSQTPADTHAQTILEDVHTSPKLTCCYESVCPRVRVELAKLNLLFNLKAVLMPHVEECPVVGLSLRSRFEKVIWVKI